MAAIRKHWLSGVLGVLIVVVIVATMLLPGAGRNGHNGRALAEGGQPPVLDPWTYSAVTVLRSELCLTQGDLAAMGCSQELSQNVLAALVAWCEEHHAALDNADQAELGAKRSLREIQRKINVGPAEAGDTNQFAAAVGQRDQAVASRQDLVAGAATVVQALLSQEQIGAWSTARANRQAPDRYRYTPSLQASQVAALKLAMRRSAGGASLAAAEDQVLTGSQKQAMAAAAANQNSFMEQVAAAEAAALPRPQDEPSGP